MVIGSELKEVLKQVLIDQGLQAVGEKMIAMKIRLKGSFLPRPRTHTPLPWMTKEVLQAPVVTELRKIKTWGKQMTSLVLVRTGQRKH